MLRKKRNEREVIVKYKYRLVVCGTDEDDFNEVSFAPIADFSVAKLVMCICIERG